MSSTVIRVEGLGKEYFIGGRERNSENFREMLVSAAAAPFRRIRRLGGRSLTEERIWALKDVSFEVKEGEVVGIIGRNGAGKSTLLKIISRITEPTEGQLTIKGRVASLLEVGTGFHPELTGRENVYLNGAILGMSRAEIARKFDEIVAFAEVEKFIDTPVKRYSSGMYMRLAFAVAAHLEPEILVVDEVLAVGDAEFQKKCLGKLGQVASKGRTILFVSHNMGAISSLCQRAILLQAGQVRYEGEASLVVANYLRTGNGEITSCIEAKRLKGYNGQVYFTAVQVAKTAEDSKTLPQVLFARPLKLNIEIESRTNAHGVSIGSTIFSRDLIPLGTQFTLDTFAIREGERRCLTLEFPALKLAPGQYTLGLSLGRGGRTASRWDYDVLIGVGDFEVLPIATGDFEAVGHWQDAWGPFVLPSARILNS